MTGLLDLPVEVLLDLQSYVNQSHAATQLLYEVQLDALSASLPLACRRLHAVFQASPPSLKAQYILHHVQPTRSIAEVVSLALRFPICCEKVLDVILRDWSSEAEDSSQPRSRSTELPRRLFRNLAPRTSNEHAYTENDAPFPLLRFLFADERIANLDADSHAGYGLARAVHAEFMPLVRLLLAKGASPANKKGLAVMIAVRKKNLALVKLLVEREEMDDLGRPRTGTSAKRRKLEDRVEVTAEMLKVAVKAKARDISDYFMHEKGVVPDMQTLNMLMR
ncbi:hypothetical protein HMN09_00425300 [Mycena chlorophos]|uniref:Ankyrin repeat protein n=1 Tax=Mycena chlorophos TaxID=658473 RepID=A0A8H6TFT4_MYCCL|nr:hypothetical protein HMN09_00425300 [Mycena chlorophos]